MAHERYNPESSRSRHPRSSRPDRDDDSVDSGYGGSAANSPKDAHDMHRDALRDYHTESAKHHAESGRRSSRPDDAGVAGSKVEGGERDTDSDSDYDPRDRYYLRVDDEEYENMTSTTAEPARDDRERSRVSERHRRERRQSNASSERDKRDGRERRERRESDASSSPSRRSDHGRNRRADRGGDREKSLSSRRRSTTPDNTSSDSGERRRKHDPPPARSDTPSSRSESHGRKGWSSRRRVPDASTASHSRHASNYRSLSPIPSDSWEEPEDPPERPPRRRRRPPPAARGTSRDDPDSARHVDPDGEAAKSFLDRLTKGVDMKSVGKTGLDAAAVAAIKIAVGTQVPWKQRIPRTVTVGAAAAIMDFVVKKTSFRPKGMIGTVYARQFVEIVLANLIVNPVSSKVTGAAQSAKTRAVAGRPGGGGGGGKGRR